MLASMAQVEIIQADAFTATPFTGNPAAVALFDADALPDDATLQDYVDRVGSEGEFCLAHFALQRWGPALLPRVRAMLGPLARRVGLPHQDLDVDCFVGRYGVTPRGIHRDPASTFMTVVAGEVTHRAESESP